MSINQALNIADQIRDNLYDAIERGKLICAACGRVIEESDVGNEPLGYRLCHWCTPLTGGSE